MRIEANLIPIDPIEQVNICVTELALRLVLLASDKLLAGNCLVDHSADHADTRRLAERYELRCPEVVLKGRLRDERHTSSDEELDHLEKRRGGEPCRSVARRRWPLTTSADEPLLDLVAADGRTRHGARDRVSEGRLA